MSDQPTDGREAAYSVSKATSDVFRHSILAHPLIRKDLPVGTEAAAARLHFTGSADPSIPVNWRFAEAVASLKGLEASILNVLLTRKYGIPLQDVTIDTDHATLFIMSARLWTIDPGEGGWNIAPTNAPVAGERLAQMFPPRDPHRARATLHRTFATGIYKCADGKYFNIHGSMNADPVADCLGLARDMDTGSFEEGLQRWRDAVRAFSSEDLDVRCNNDYRQAGTICYSVDEFRASAHAKANRHVGLWEIYDHPTSSQAPCWWPSSSSTSVAKPLAGLKVVDLTRIIAGPAVTRSLAEFGASVMRCTSPSLPDQSVLHPDLNWGKWNCSIDLTSSEDRQKLRDLILEADVVVQGYRPSALDKYGFSQQDIIDLCKHRERGIVSVRENCYGWHGPWAARPGWQEISDSCVGVARSFGEAMGHDEPVIPIFPHSDYCTGIVGSCAILIALLRWAEKGGSYAVDLALNYYTTWLVESVGEYPRPVFERVWQAHGRRVWRSHNRNLETAMATVENLREGVGGTSLLRPDFFEDRMAPGILGEKKFRHVKSVARWPAGTVEPGFRVGTRGNGVDAARWPEDLSVESVIS